MGKSVRRTNLYNTIQYNEEFALKNWQTNCQFNLAHKLKRTEMFKKNKVRDTKNRNTVKCKTDKIWKNDWNKKKLK